MRPEAEAEIEPRLPKNARVLDIGAAREPFRRATHIVDMLTRAEARATFGRYFNDPPIADANWIAVDVCDSKPLPFPDKFFDFVVCSHTLEDIRDPIRVCQEMSRVAKAGYIECPSPLLELTKGVDRAGGSWVGYAHHRWIVSTASGGLEFVMKPHFVHGSTRFHFSPGFADALSAERRFTKLFWTGAVEARERVFVSRDDLEAHIEGRIRAEIGDRWSMRRARASRWIRRSVMNTVRRVRA